MFGFGLLFIFVILGLVALVALDHFGVLPRRQHGTGALVDPADLARLEDALTALERRLERVEDQQRFVERLLESRPDSPSLPPGGKAREAPPSDQRVDSVLFDVEREGD